MPAIYALAQTMLHVSLFVHAAHVSAHNLGPHCPATAPIGCTHCRLLAEYLEAAAPAAVAEAVELLAGPALLRLVHTRYGAYIGCAVLAYGTPKDRKKAIKAMKGEHSM